MKNFVIALLILSPLCIFAELDFETLFKMRQGQQKEQNEYSQFQQAFGLDDQQMRQIQSLHEAKEAIKNHNRLKGYLSRILTADYSCGTNIYGRTEAQQRSYEEALDVNSFFGAKFAEIITKDDVILLRKPFRGIEHINRHVTKLGRVCEIKVEGAYSSEELMEREFLNFANIIANKYKVFLHIDESLGNHWLVAFSNKNIVVSIFQDGLTVSLSMEKRTIREMDYEEYKKIKAEKERQKGSNVDNNGIDLL